MRKKMNAFTLIELLAVIVILAIIALIATPIILGIVEDAKKDAFLRSVELVISTTDIDIANKTFDENYTYTITDGDISNMEVSIKNTKGMNGNITYDINGNESYAIHNGVYCVKKTMNSKAEITDYNGDCALTLENATSEACFETEDLDDGGVAITKYNYCPDDDCEIICPRDVVIPSTINGKVVKEISDAKFMYDGDMPMWVGGFSQLFITSVQFPTTLEKIGERAFYSNAISGEMDLRHLTNLKSIGDMAFYYNEITSVQLPNTLESIGEQAFSENEITYVKFPDNITSTGGAFSHNAFSGELDLSMYSNLTSIDAGSFSGKDAYEYDDNGNEIVNYLGEITSIKLPSGVTSIGQNAFAGNAFEGELDLSMYSNLTNISGFGNNKITSIKLPKGVTNIGEDAFEGNTFEGELDLSMYTNLTTIERYAFNGGEKETYDEENYDFIYESLGKITSIKLPNTLESIGYSAFSHNKISGELDLSHLTNLTTIDGFSNNLITSVKLPNTAETIEDCAFQNNKILGTLDLSNTGVTSIGYGAFDGNDDGTGNQITKVLFPNSIESISGFRNNAISGELDLSIYPNLTTIDDFVWNNITSVKLPSSITYIEDSTFYNNALTSVTFYGRTNLDDIYVGDDAWGWADGYSDANIYFVNE